MIYRNVLVYVSGWVWSITRN